MKNQISCQTFLIFILFLIVKIVKAGGNDDNDHDHSGRDNNATLVVFIDHLWPVFSFGCFFIQVFGGVLFATLIGVLILACRRRRLDNQEAIGSQQKVHPESGIEVVQENESVIKL